MKKLCVLLLHGILPLAVVWVRWQESRILKNGVPLDDAGLIDARLMGVTRPEKIRLMNVDRIPFLNSRFIKLLSAIVPAISPNTAGLSLRHGIYIRSQYRADRHLIAHECVHTGQYERIGSIAGFLSAYFTQCIETGYPEAALEKEAVRRSAGLI